MAMFMTATCAVPATAARLAKMNQEFPYSVVDVQSVSPHTPESAIRRGTFTEPDYIVGCDLLVVGGGLGGVAAALRATADDASVKRGIKVCLTEETDWIGGQITSQGVSVLDENYLVEGSGACRSYQQLRGSIRNHYKQNFQLTDEAAENFAFNPGSCWVTRLSFEPKVALDILYEMLKPAIDGGRLSIYKRSKPIYVKLKSGEIICAGANQGRPLGKKEVQAVGVLDFETGKITEFRPTLCLDATELGDLLPLVGLEYSTGSDSRKDTGEPHAPEVGNKDNVQDFTYPFDVEYRPNEKNLIEKPPHYEEFKEKGKFSFAGYKMFESVKRPAPMVVHEGNHVEEHGWYDPFWTYRRLLAKQNFASGMDYDLATINWESNDLRGENIIDQPSDVEANRLALGKSVSLGFLYWLQREAPRDDGGNGYPELTLRSDVLGTTDGCSKYPYIRESRRVRAHQTIGESDIVASTNSGARARAFSDSVGIGFYPVDIHGHQEIPGAGQETKPFQIPLGALIPKQETNVLPACKNIGTTHITNGAYRLHPVEWAIGEAQGTLCTLLLNKSIKHQTLFETASILNLQHALVENGAPIYWFDDVPTSHPGFAAIQFLTICDIISPKQDDLQFRPEDAVTRGEAALALARVLPGAYAASKDAESALTWCLLHSYLQEAEEGLMPDATLTPADGRSLLAHFKIWDVSADHKITRSQFAQLIYQVAIKHLEAAKP